MAATIGNSGSTHFPSAKVIAHSIAQNQDMKRFDAKITSKVIDLAKTFATKPASDFLNKALRITTAVNLAGMFASREDCLKFSWVMQDVLKACALAREEVPTSQVQTQDAVEEPKDGIRIRTPAEPDQTEKQTDGLLVQDHPSEDEEDLEVSALFPGVASDVKKGVEPTKAEEQIDSFLVQDDSNGDELAAAASVESVVDITAKSETK